MRRVLRAGTEETQVYSDENIFDAIAAEESDEELEDEVDPAELRLVAD